MSPEQRKWHKLTDVLSPEEVAKARPDPSPYVQVRLGVLRTSFRMRFEENGKCYRETLPRTFNDLKDWRRAQREVEIRISQIRFGEKPDAEKPALRSDEVCNQIVARKRSLDPATYQQAETFYRVHIKPFLNGLCAYAEEEGRGCPFQSYLEAGACVYARDFKPPTWLNYKTHYRLHRPQGSLFNHWKFFVTLGKTLFEDGVIPKKIRLEFNEQKEDHRKRGMLIPDEHFRAMIRAANHAWRDRMILGRLTGQRPGLLRELRKDRLDLGARVLRIRKEDSKNRRAYEFVVPAPVLSILEERLAGSPGPFFFPSETDPEKPMDKHLGGWKGALKRAGVDARYTPHDLRHTRLTELFRTPGINHALTCYQHDLSLEEAMRTYIHFDAQDTRVIAQDSERVASHLFPEVPET